MAERSSGQKILIGCGIASVVVVMLGVGSCVAFVAWLGRPGEMLRGERLVGPETDGYVEWTLRLEDPGTSRAVDSIFEELRDVQRKASPESDNAAIRWLQDASRQRNERQFHAMFPAVVAWCTEPGASGGGDHVFAASLNATANRLVLLDWILARVFGPGTNGAGAEVYGDERIYRMGSSGFAIFLREGSVFAASTDAAARRAVDRLASPAAAEATQVRELLRDVPATSPLRGALRNERGEAEALLSTLGVWPDASDEAEKLGGAMRDVLLRGGFDERSALAGEMRFRCDAPGCAALLASLAGKELLPAGDGSRSLRLAEASGAGGRLEFRVDRPVEALGRRFEAMLGQRGEERDDEEDDR